MSPLETLVADELTIPVDPRVSHMAAAIAANHPGSLAVLFYGSCLRDATLSGMLDFYVIVEDYRRAYDRKWLATANRLLPPNVFPFAQDNLSAKYAVLSLADLRRETGWEARDASTVARFAQPCRLTWQSDADMLTEMASAQASAVMTLLRWTAVLASDVADDGVNVWKAAFVQTFNAELRAERSNRGASLVDSNESFFQAAWRAALDENPWLAAQPWDEEEQRGTKALWRKFRRTGKMRQVGKLAKASLTFAGGIDYLAWKIARHSGEAVVVTPWQRRHPLLAALVMLPRLIARGQVR